MEIEHQICLSHGTHLSVCDILNKDQPRMETQAGPNEDSSNDENYDEAEKDDSTEEPHDFSDSLKPLITKVEQLFTGWKHGFLRGSVSFSAVLACFGAPLGHYWLLFYFKREMGSLENKNVFIRLSYFTIIPSEETPDPVSDSFL